MHVAEKHVPGTLYVVIEVDSEEPNNPGATVFSTYEAAAAYERELLKENAEQNGEVSETYCVSIVISELRGS